MGEINGTIVMKESHAGEQAVETDQSHGEDD
jgi:hypothetical protein